MGFVEFFHGSNVLVDGAGVQASVHACLPHSLHFVIERLPYLVNLFDLILFKLELLQVFLFFSVKNHHSRLFCVDVFYAFELVLLCFHQSVNLGVVPEIIEILHACRR